MSPTRLDPLNISTDAAALSRIAIPYCRFPHPDVVKRFEGAVFPVIREHKSRGKCGTVRDCKGQDRPVMYDDNTTPRWAFLWSHGYERTDHPKGWTFAHVWNASKDPDAYTHLANLVMMPECFSSLSDKDGPLVPHLRCHAEAVYGWCPAGRTSAEAPPGHHDLTWNYLEPHPDPAGFILRRMDRLNNQRVRSLRGLRG